MALTEFSLKFKTTIYVLIVGIFIVGLGAYQRLPLEDSPEIEIPYILVHTFYPGVAPEDMERLVTNVIERELKELKDVKEITSSSQESVSMITLEFESDIDTDDAYQKVRDKVDTAKPDLPSDAEEPQIIEINTTDFPIMQIIVSGDYGLDKLKLIGESLEDMIEQISGILGVDLIGGLDREIYIFLNPERLEYYKLGVEQVIGRIQQEHRTTPAGSLELGGSKYSVRIPGEYKDVSLMADIVVKAPQGKPIKISDIGRVVDGYKDRETISRLNGKECVALRVRKQSGENIVRIADEIKLLLEQQKSFFPSGTEVRIVQDSSEMIREQVDNVENSIISGLLMVILVLWISLGFRNAAFVASAIPLSMLITFAALEFMGVTLNIVVLFSLILALGMLVDNSIVVIENIYRHASTGKNLRQAAVEATSEVTWPIVASTATTVAAFWPLLYMPGIAGDFMYFMPLTVITALAATLFVALVINPVVAGDFLTSSNEVLFDDSGEARTPILRRYRAVLEWSLRHPITLVSLCTAMLVITVVLYLFLGSGVEFFPETPPLRAQVLFEGPQGLTLERTDTIIRQVETIALAEDNSESVIGNSGFSAGSGGLFGGSGGTHEGVVDLEFKDRKERSHSTWDTIASIRNQLKGLVGGEFKVKTEDKGPPTGDPVSVEISGPDYGIVNDYANRALTLIQSVNGAIELETDYDGSRPEIRVEVDREKAMLRKVNSANVASAVSAAINGTTASVLREGNEEYDIVVKYDDPYRQSIQNILDIRVTGADDVQVPLRDVAAIVTAGGMGSVKHIDGDRSVKISGEVAGRSSSEVMIDVEKSLRENLILPAGYQYHFAGENEIQTEMSDYLKKAFGIGILLIALILITQFNSLTRPFIILGSVVMSLNGVLIGLLVTQNKFSIMMTGMGIISLAGVVVNNAIVLIDYIEKLRAQGFPVKESLIRAGMVRFRPVLLTAITTVLGMIPMATGVSIDFKRFTLDIGSENALWWGPMAQAVIFGLVFATGLTLILVPVMYYMQEHYSIRIKRFFRQHLVSLSSVVLLISCGLFIPETSAQAERPLLIVSNSVMDTRPETVTPSSDKPDNPSAIVSECPSASNLLRPADPQDDIPVAPDGEQPVPVISMEEAMALAVRNNPSIKTMYERIRQADYLVDKAWAILLPNLDSNASWTRNESEIAFPMSGTDGSVTQVITQEKYARHLGINASTTLFNARAYPLLQYAYDNVSRTTLSADHGENNLLVAVAGAYYQVEAAHKAVEVAVKSLKNAEEFLKLSEGLRRVGQATRIDALRAESQVIDARNMQQNAQDGVEVAYTALAALIDFTGPFTIAPPQKYQPVSTDLPTLLELAWHQRKDLESARIQVSMEQWLQRDILCQWVPKFSLNYSWQWNSSSGFSDDNDSWNVEVAASWSILDGGARRAEYLTQKSELQIARNTVKQMELDIYKEIEENLLIMNKSRRSLELTMQQVKIMEETHRLISRQFEVGMATSLDLQFAVAQLADVCRQRVVDELNFALSALMLNKSVGVYLR
ncbi:efflux RND transporter permease subunit [bacterium]|nr:efflux RND transporter permease subunit [candidate division CSSED10-310 bacterium]